MAHDRAWHAATRSIVSCRKQTPQDWLDAQHRKEPATDKQAADRTRRRVEVEAKAGVGPGQCSREYGLVIAQLLPQRVREHGITSCAPALPSREIRQLQHDQLFRVLHRQRGQLDRLQQLEYGRVRAYAERQRQDGHNGEYGASPQGTKTMTQVASQVFEQGQASLVTERVHRLQRPSRFHWCVSTTLRILFRHLQMDAKLFLQVRIMPPSRHGSPETVQPFAKAAHAIAHRHASPCVKVRMMVAIRSHTSRSLTS